MFVSLMPVTSFAASTSYKEDIRVEEDKDIDVEDFISKMNQEMEKIYNIHTDGVNFTVSTQFGKATVYKISKISTAQDLGYVLVYGKPFGSIKTVNGKKVRRYLGKARYSTNDPNDGFTNIGFPYDVYSGWKFPDLLPGSGYDSKFIENPWVNSEDKIGKDITSFIDIVFYENPVAKSKIKKQIALGIKIVHPELVGDESKFDQIPWEKYVHIYQPPTYNSWGMGVIWHNGPGGKVFYKTIPIAPFCLVESKYVIMTAK